MNRFLPVLVFCFACSASAFAQATPQFEVFGGGTWLRADVSPDLSPLGTAHLNAFGWNASATENVNRWFGGTADFSGAYSRPTITDPVTGISSSNEVNTSTYTFTFGPTFAYRKASRVVLFGRALFGAANSRESTTSKGAIALGAPAKFSDTRFAIVAGGGTDIPLSRALALRGTVDWVHTTFNDVNADRQNSLRVSAGVVFRFSGER
jgi:hypothetical protein